MFSTPITRAFGLTTPIVNAGMAMVARPELAAAVSNAGALGTIGCDISAPVELKALIGQVRERTARPFGVDLIGDFLTDGHIDVLIEERIPVAIFFWTLPARSQIQRLRHHGVAVWIQVGSVHEADAAVALGIDALIVQGSEAGGHNRSEASTMAFFPHLRRRYPELPMLAAGGIVDGATMAGALALGADAVWCGSRFLASREAAAHDDYKARVIASEVGDTAMTTAYGPEWPDQPIRVIVTRGLREWGAGSAAGDEAMGTTLMGGERLPLPRFSAILPTRDFEGDIEYACLTAGQSIGNIDAIRPAAEIVQAMTDEAIDVISRLADRISSRKAAA